MADAGDFFDEPRRNGDERTQDQPITGSWKLRADIGGSPAKGKRQQQQQEANEILLGDLWIAYRSDPARFVSYSRRTNFYAARSRYWPRAITYSTVMRFVRNNAEWQNIEHFISSSRQLGMQSRMRLTDITVQGFASLGVKVTYDPPELIILRDINKRLVDYADNDETREDEIKCSMFCHSALLRTKRMTVE